MADPFSNWGDTGSSSGSSGPFSNWGGSGGGFGSVKPYTPPSSGGTGGGGHSVLPFGLGGVVHAIENNPITHEFGVAGREAKQIGFNFVPALETTGKVIWHDLGIGLPTGVHRSTGWGRYLDEWKYFVPTEYLHGSRISVANKKENSWSALLDPSAYAQLYLHDPNTAGGALLTPTYDYYKHKYYTTHVLQNMWNDPVGTLLDLSVVGKGLGRAHLAQINRAAEAGRLAEGSLAHRISNLSPRGFKVIVPGYDHSIGEGETLAEGGLYLPIGHRGATSYGRAFDLGLDAMRAKIPASVPFSVNRLSGRMLDRWRGVKMVRYEQATRKAQIAAAGLSDVEQAAIPWIAELPRDVKDPIGAAQTALKNELAKVQAATGDGFDASAEVGLKATIAELGRLHENRDLLYNPSPELRNAVNLYHEAYTELNKEMVARKILSRDQINARRVLVHRLLAGTRYVEKHTNTGWIDEPKYKPRLEAATTEKLGAREVLTKANKRVTETARRVNEHTTKPIAEIRRVYEARLRRLGQPPGPFERFVKENYEKRKAPEGVVGRALADHTQALKDQREAQRVFTKAHGEFKAAKAMRKKKRFREDVLGQFHGGLTHEEALQGEARALESHSLAEAGLENTGLHGPLAQYGPSFRHPHYSQEDSLNMPHTRATVSATRREVGAYVRRATGTQWLRGMILHHPEAMTMDILRQYRDVTAQDMFDQWVIPLSGRLDYRLAATGFKHPKDYYIQSKAGAIPSELRRRAALLEHRVKDMTNDEQFTRDQIARFMAEDQLPADLRRENFADDDAFFQALNEAGVRRVPKDVFDEWQRQMKGSNALARFTKRYINGVWRYLLLGIKPAWSVANVMTNEMLVGFKYAGVGGLRAFINLVRSDRGERGVRELGRLTVKMPLGPNEMRGAMQELGPEAFSGTWAKQYEAQKQRPGALAGWENKRAVAKAVHTIANWAPAHGLLHVLDAPRRWNEAFNQWGENFARGQVALTELHKFTGIMATTSDEVRAAIKQAQDDGHWETIVEHIYDITGNYSNLNRTEREGIVTMMPFYPWFKTILGITAKLAVRNPERFWVLNNVANAFAQTQQQNFALGIPTPEFAQSLFPLFAAQNGQQEVLNPRAANPFQTPIDIANTLAALGTGNLANVTPGETGLSMFGPIPQAAYVAASGKDPYYGGAYKGPGQQVGPLAAGIGSVFNLPQLRLYQQLRGEYKSKVYNAPTGPSPVPGLNEGQYIALLQYLGVPVRQINVQNMKTRALEDRGVSTQSSYSPPSSSSGSSPFSNWGSP